MALPALSAARTLHVNAPAARSPRWPWVRQSHLAQEPWCRACGGTLALEVHHIIPFHVAPELELVTSNLITLCEARPTLCHLVRGHLHDWRKINPAIVAQSLWPRPQGI